MSKRSDDDKPELSERAEIVGDATDLAMTAQDPKSDELGRLGLKSLPMSEWDNEDITRGVNGILLAQNTARFIDAPVADAIKDKKLQLRKGVMMPGEHFARLVTTEMAATENMRRNRAKNSLMSRMFGSIGGFAKEAEKELEEETEGGGFFGLFKKRKAD